MKINLIYKLIFLIIFIFCSTFESYAQKVHHFNTLSTKEGLSSQLGCYYFYQSPKGQIWISSFFGLNSFDGKTVKNYLPIPNDSTSITDPEIIGPIIGGQGEDFWISTVEGIHRYKCKSDNFQRITLQNDYHKNVTLLNYDSLTNNIWGFKDNKIFFFNPNTNKNVEVIDSISGLFGRGLSMIYEPQKKVQLLLIPYRNGFEIRTYSNGKKLNQVSKYFATNKDFPIYSFYYERKNAIWLGTKNNGFIKYNPLTDETLKINHFQKKSINDVIGITSLNENNLLITTRKKGLFIFDKIKSIITSQVYHRIGKYSEPYQENIESVYLDQHQNIWLYTPGNGINYTSLIKNKFPTYLSQDLYSKSKSSYISALMKNHSNQLWAYTKEGIFIAKKSNHENDIKFELIKDNFSLIDGSVPYFLFNDRKNRMWIINNKGVFLRNNKNTDLNKINVKPTGIVPAFNSIYELPNGQIILNSFFSGAYQVIEKNNEIFLQSWDQVDNDKSFAYTFVGSKILINEAYEGLHIMSLEEGKLKQDTFFAFSDFVTGIVEQDFEAFWITTSSNLFSLKKIEGRFSLETQTQFKFKNIKSVLSDTLNNLWIATNNEIICYTPDTYNFKKYTLSDGLQPKEFNDWVAIKWSEQQLVFGGSNGINVINPYKKHKKIVNAKPQINHLLINDLPPVETIQCDYTGSENISNIKKLSFPYKNNTLSFRFAALDYTDPDANEFKYRITPTETEWVHSGTENFARYANLAPGDYTFEVDATNSDGIWSNNPAQLDITILPPWYQTWWFRTLAAFGIAGIIYLIYRNRVQQIQKEADFKRKEAEYKQLAAETETAVLRLQMNPHFIFNSMNSISSYLLQKDIETANDYLGRFAKLMRKILIVAEEPYLPLYDEIELLEQYMQAEAMRFEEKFQYEFIVADEIDTDEVLIPTMILQPFVENAIWHGISNKKGKGNIEIRFDLEQDKLICSITDNGIGRKAANQNNSSSHESKAITITQRRLNLLVSEHNLSFQPSLAIQDLVNPQNQPIGTKAIITLPLI